MCDCLSLEEVGQPLACTGSSIRSEPKEIKKGVQLCLGRRRQNLTRPCASDATTLSLQGLCASAIVSSNAQLQIQSSSSWRPPLCCEQREDSIENNALEASSMRKLYGNNACSLHGHLVDRGPLSKLPGIPAKHLYRSHSSSAQIMYGIAGKLPRRGFPASHHELPWMRPEDHDARTVACDHRELLRHHNEEACLGIQTMRMTLQERSPSKPALIERRQSVKDQTTSPTMQHCEQLEVARTNHAGSYLCNWGAVDDSCLGTLMDVLSGLGWDRDLREDLSAITTEASQPPGRNHRFFDLGCGDGRVVIEVCKRFSTARGTGVELNGSLVLAAQARAKRQGDDLIDRCDFRQEDLTKMRDLRSADVIFLYLPRNALQTVVGEVFPKSDLRNGTIIFTAAEALPEMPDLFSRVSKSRQNHEARRLFWYTWNNTRGSQNEHKPSWIPP